MSSDTNLLTWKLINNSLSHLQTFCLFIFFRKELFYYCFKMILKIIALIKTIICINNNNELHLHFISFFNLIFFLTSLFNCLWTVPWCQIFIYIRFKCLYFSLAWAYQSLFHVHWFVLALILLYANYFLEKDAFELHTVSAIGYLIYGH